MDKRQLINTIKAMVYPEEENQHYFEYSSADGFAFLGAAKAILGLDFEFELQAVRERNYSLNHVNYIGGIKVTEKNGYVYTMWTCVEFLLAAGEVRSAHILSERIRTIGIYPELGLHRYCGEEVLLAVPNVTSAAALVFVRLGDRKWAEVLVDGLRKWQKGNGNWDYLQSSVGSLQSSVSSLQSPVYSLQSPVFSLQSTDGDWKAVREEDCFHVGMMIYHLRELEKIGIRTWDMVNRALNWLVRDEERCPACGKSDGWFCEGSVGWGVPMLTLAISGLGKQDRHWERLEQEGRELTVRCLEHRNFRVRGMSAWVLAKLGSLGV